jgi:cobalt/nickel transport system permease protein
LGLAGIMLGWSALPALFIALFLQGLLFQFGGLLSLGINTAAMGSAALAGGLVFRSIPEKHKLFGSFAGGFAAVIVGTLVVVAALSLSDSDLRTTAALLFAANLPLAAVEGVMSLFIVAFLAKMLPGYVSRPARI